MTLVIMAAGMGSRFGGLKQIEPVTKHKEFILDFSIYDAILNGFEKVVFIIKEENLEIFKNTIGNRLENKIKVEYVFQNNNNIPSNAYIPKDRIKPLGTAHAILCAKDKVDTDFVVINADDFYGRDAYKVASNFIKNNKEEYAMVGYNACNTLSENGSVKRGVCYQKEGYLDTIIECSIEKINNNIKATPLDNNKSFEINLNHLVSMNMFILKKDIFKYLEEYFYEFFDKNKNNMDKAEYLLPEVIEKLIKENKIKVKVLETNSKWMGITYKEDLNNLIENINKNILDGTYKDNLWSNL